MPDRYWVGGTANWDNLAGTKWSATSGGAGGASVPTSADAVFFSNLSSGTCTIALGNNGAGSIDCTGFTGTLAGGATITVAGSITLVAGMTYSHTGTVTVSNTGTITSGGKSFSNLTFTGSGATYTLGSALTVTNATTLSFGTLDLNGFTASTGTFSSANSNTRAIAFGSSNIALTSTTASAVIISMSVATNFTSSGTGGFTRVQSASSTIRIGTTAGSSSATAVNFTITSGFSGFGITVGTSLKNLDLVGYTGAASGDPYMYGNLTLGSGGIYSSGFDCTFKGSGTLTTSGQQIVNVVCDAAGGTLTLGDPLSCTSINVVSGTFSTSASNHSISALDFVSQGTAVRTVNFNSSTVTLPTSFPWIIDATNLTLTGTYNLVFSGNGITWEGKGLSYHNVSFTGLGVTTQSLFIEDDNSFNTLTIGSATAVGVKQVEFFGNQTIGTFVCSGSTRQNRIGLYGSPFGAARTLTVGTWTTKANVDFRNITAAGASAPWSGTSLGNCGGNTSITFDTPKTVYWNLAGAQTVFAAGWALTSGGTPSLTNQPLAQDTCVFDNTGSVTGTITFSVCNIGTIDMSARTSAMTISVSNTTCEMYGNWVSGSGTTISGAPNFRGSSPQTITSAGKSFGAVVVDSASSVTLQDAFAGTSISLEAGTFNANIYNVTVVNVTTPGTGTKTLAMGSGTWSISASGASAWSLGVTNLTVTGSATISMTSASAKTFNSTGVTGYANTTVNQGGAGQLTFVGSNTFANITNTYSATGATSVRFTGGTTNEFTAFNLTGESGRACTLTSTNLVQAILRKATPWDVGANSTNGGNNTGLSFTAGGGIDFLVISYINGVFTGGTTYAVSVAEAASGVDVVSSIVSFTYAASVAEAASGVDTVSARLLFSSAVADSASGVDTSSAFAAFRCAVVEASSGVDASSAQASLGGTVFETASGIDTLTSNAAFTAALLEFASGLDNVSPAGSVFNTSVLENITALDLFSALYLWNLIDDSQTPNWQNVASAQSPTWTDIDDSQTPGWTPINS
jgi:hypothetical protein